LLNIYPKLLEEDDCEPIEPRAEPESDFIPLIALVTSVSEKGRVKNTFAAPSCSSLGKKPGYSCSFLIS
jgi:hypothetical protein